MPTHIEMLIHKIIAACGSQADFEMAEQLLTEIEMVLMLERPDVSNHMHYIRIKFNELCTLSGQGMPADGEDYRQHFEEFKQMLILTILPHI